MIILAVGSVGAGYFLASASRLADGWSPRSARWCRRSRRSRRSLVPILTVLVSAVGVLVAYWSSAAARCRSTGPSRRLAAGGRGRRADVGGNAINETLFARPGIWLTRALVFVDTKGVDGAVNGDRRRCWAAVRPAAPVAERFRPVAMRCPCSAAPIVVLAALLVVRF